ncbi:MAG TPA: mucoidy inhibitor MuiA family protein, partial [Steroidobacteraceae bacterium]|nr:mucoidy inhibitor MuiA family protein [Steroidobacteraceae bacterium]
MRSITAAVIAGAISIGLAPAAGAADIVAALTIDQVTVYRDSAIVTRSGRVDIPAGEHRLIIRGLSDRVDPATLRLSAASRGLKLAGVEVQHIVEGDLVNPAERALTKKLRDIDDHKAAIADEIASAQSQIKLLDSVVASPTGSGMNAPAVPAANIPVLVNAVGNNDAAARSRIRAARLQIRDLDAEAETVKAELAKIATARKATTELRVSVTATAAGTVPVSLDYQMTGVSWNWEYEARLDTQTKKVSLVRQAQLTQGTGEDWKNVELTISTARPGMNAVTPPIASAFLKFAAPQYAGDGASLDEVVVTGMRSSRDRMREKSAEMDMSGTPEQAASATAEVFSTDFVADYRIPGRVSVDADRQPRVYPINDDVLDVDLVARAILPADRAAYLEAKLTYKGDVPIDAGEVQLYRDDAFVGLGALPLVLPGADVRIPFGQDDRIRIVV